MGQTGEWRSDPFARYQWRWWDGGRFTAWVGQDGQRLEDPKWWMTQPAKVQDEPLADGASAAQAAFDASIQRAQPQIAGFRERIKQAADAGMLEFSAADWIVRVFIPDVCDVAARTDGKLPFQLVNGAGQSVDRHDADAAGLRWLAGTLRRHPAIVDVDTALSGMLHARAVGSMTNRVPHAGNAATSGAIAILCGDGRPTHDWTRNELAAIGRSAGLAV